MENTKKPRGRPRKYESEADRQEAHRVQSLQSYYRSPDEHVVDGKKRVGRIPVFKDKEEKRRTIALNKRVRTWYTTLVRDWEKLTADEFRTKYSKLMSTEDEYGIVSDYCRTKEKTPLLRVLLVSHFQSQKQEDD